MPKISLNASKKTKLTAAGEIPVDWRCSKLGAHLTIKHGFAFDSKWFSGNGDYVLLTPGSFHEAGGYRDQKDKTKYYTGEIPSGYLLEKGDLLLAMTEQAEGLLGSALRVPDDGKFLHNQRLGLVRAKDRRSVSLDFAYWLYNWSKVRKAITITASGTKVHHTSPGKLLEIDVPLPPLPEQEKIAEILSTWDEALEKLDALIDAKQRRKKGLMQQLLSGKKRLGSGAGAWPVVRLGDVAKNVADANKGRMGGAQLYGVTKADGVVPMREHVKGADFSRCKHVEPNWFAYNPMRINIGSIAQWRGDQTVMVSGDYVVFRCLEKKLLPSYLDHFRQTDRWQYFMKIAGNGSVRVRIYFHDLAELRFPCPPVEEQKAIADLLDICDAELSLLRRERDTLDLQKRGLMQRLLTGRIRVHL